MNISNVFKQLIVARRERKAEEKRIKREEKEALKAKNKINSEYRKELLSIVWKIFRNKQYVEQEFGDLDPQLIERIKTYGNGKQLFGFITMLIPLWIVWTIYPYLDNLGHFLLPIMKIVYSDAVMQKIAFVLLTLLAIMILYSICSVFYKIYKGIKNLITLIRNS